MIIYLTQYNNKYIKLDDSHVELRGKEESWVLECCCEHFRTLLIVLHLVFNAHAVLVLPCKHVCYFSEVVA